MPPRARTPSSGDNSPYAAHANLRAERTPRLPPLTIGRATCFYASSSSSSSSSSLAVHRRRRRRFCGCKRNIDIVFTVGTLIICALLLNLAILLNRYGAHRTAQPEVAGGHHGHDSISAGRISSKHYAGTRAIGVASSRQRPDARSTAPPAASIAASVAAETIPATAAPAVSVELAAAVADAAVAGPAAVVVEATTQPPTAPTEAPTAAPPATAAPNQIIAAAAAVVTTVKAAAPATPTTAPAAATAADAFPTGPVVDGISVLPDRGALWDRNLCPRRKDNKPYKIHVWFSHVQEGMRFGLCAPARAFSFSFFFFTDLTTSLHRLLF